MSDRDVPEEGKPTNDRRAVIFLSGFYAPVLASLLYQAEALYARDPLALKDVRALRDDIETQIRQQYPSGWTFNND